MPDPDDTRGPTGSPMSPTRSAAAKRETGGGTTKALTPMAEAMRRWRRRKQGKRRSLRVDLSEEYLDQLASDGWIATEQVTNPEILGSVIEDICDTKRRGVFRSGPILTGTATSS